MALEIFRPTQASRIKWVSMIRMTATRINRAVRGKVVRVKVRDKIHIRAREIENSRETATTKAGSKVHLPKALDRVLDKAGVKVAKGVVSRATIGVTKDRTKVVRELRSQRILPN